MKRVHLRQGFLSNTNTTTYFHHLRFTKGRNTSPMPISIKDQSISSRRVQRLPADSGLPHTQGIYPSICTHCHVESWTLLEISTVPLSRIITIWQTFCGYIQRVPHQDSLIKNQTRTINNARWNRANRRPQHALSFSN